MSGSRPTPAEQHLGDRLSALVDGELGHESRERVLAHLATCAKCKAEADAQRRLKNVFAEMAPPPPSESFLARLHGLPGGGDFDGGGPPLGGGGFGRRLPGPAGFPAGASGSGVFGVSGESFGYVPSRPHATSLTPSEGRSLTGGRGFRIHDVSRHEAERSASRGLRFAAAAAGAVSLAAIALGGVTTGVPTDTAADVRGAAPGSGSVTPARMQGTGAATVPESQRRRSVVPLLGQGRRSAGEAPVAPMSVSAPLLPGIPAPAAPEGSATHTLTTPVLAGAAAMSPLVHPLIDAQPLTSASWPTAPEVTAPEVTAPEVTAPEVGAPGPQVAQLPALSSAPPSRTAP